MQNQHKPSRRQYVFGYGSLICPQSRAVTAQALRGGVGNSASEESDGDGAIPVRLHGWVRLWNTRGRNTYLGLERCAGSDDDDTTAVGAAGDEADDSVRRGGRYAAAAPSSSSAIVTTPEGGDFLRSHPLPTRPSCVGVLVPLDGDDTVLDALDRREGAYRREKVDPASIERVDDLLIREDDGIDGSERREEAIQDRYYKNTFWERRPHHGDEGGKVSGREEPGAAVVADSPTPPQSDRDSDADAVCVWVYVPLERYRGMARPENPILQSYVDICLRGCVSISDAFAKEFVEGTYGWFPGHSHLIPAATGAGRASSDSDDSSSEGSSSSCWIDDRKNPVYIRADKEYSLKHSSSLDALLDRLLLRRRGPVV